MELINKYETVFVLNPELSEDDTKALVEKFTGLISTHGTIEKTDEWGKRKLAYPINYETEGYYVLINFACEESFPAELDRVINITDGVLRSLIVAKGE